MKKQINCKHYIKESKKTSVYSYALVGADLNLCVVCEKKLRRGILEQDAVEREMKAGIYKEKNVKQDNTKFNKGVK